MADVNRLQSLPLPSAVAALLIFAYALSVAFGTFDPPDLYIYRYGAVMALRGENPYDIEAIRREVADRKLGPDTDTLKVNCGYFLPPMSVLVYAPLAALPWVSAKVAWAVVTGFAAFAVACLPWLVRPRGSPPPGTLAVLLVPFLLVCNPLAIAIVLVGQTSLVFAGCVAAGLWAFDRGKPYVAALIWVVPFMKPHLALPLIPLAWYLGGLRPALLLIALVGLLNLVGATVIGGSPLFLKDYIDFLPNARTAVSFNRVESNPSVTSWNSLLFHAGGPLIELSVGTIAAGYLVWFGLVVGRCVAAKEKPSAAWAVAAAAVGAVMCSQVLVYELFFLTAAVPWVRDLFTGGYRLRGWAAVALMACQLIPQKLMESYGVPVHHPLAVMLFALLVLTGPLQAARSPSGRD